MNKTRCIRDGALEFDAFNSEYYSVWEYINFTTNSFKFIAVGLKYQTFPYYVEHRQTDEKATEFQGFFFA